MRVSGFAVGLMLQLVPFQCSASVRLEVPVLLEMPTAQASFALITALLSRALLPVLFGLATTWNAPSQTGVETVEVDVLGPMAGPAG
jgi:hypothetical protein